MQYASRDTQTSATARQHLRPRRARTGLGWTRSRTQPTVSAPDLQADRRQRLKNTAAPAVARVTREKFALQRQNPRVSACHSGCSCQAAHDLRSRVRRFESCWGRRSKHIFRIYPRSTLSARPAERDRISRPSTWRFILRRHSTRPPGRLLARVRRERSPLSERPMSSRPARRAAQAGCATADKTMCLFRGQPFDEASRPAVLGVLSAVLALRCRSHEVGCVPFRNRSAS
jgi:hypothetical protein